MKKIVLSVSLFACFALFNCSNRSKPEPYLEQPLTITCTKGPLILCLYSSTDDWETEPPKVNLKISKNLTNWEDMNLTVQVEKHKLLYKFEDLMENETIYIKGDNPSGFSYLNPSGALVLSFDSSETPDAEFEVSGNIMSLIDADGYINLKTMPVNSNFTTLFEETGVFSANKLVLPCDELTPFCYSCMFKNCEKLVNCPSLPAVTLSNSCYLQMFYGCNLLKEAPLILPATKLEVCCYSDMFLGCSVLESGPELSAKTLADESCKSMFSRTNLNHLKVAFGENDEWPINYDATFSWLPNHRDDEGEYIFEWKGSENPEFPRSDDTVPKKWTIKSY